MPPEVPARAALNPVSEMLMKHFSITCAALAVVLLSSVVAVAQVAKTVTVFQLGGQETKIPVPEGFEEAASQFENVKHHFTVTEDPGNDMLGVYLTHDDCEKLRGGEFGPFNFYTKVSVRRVIRAEDYSAERFANLVATFRKSGSQVLDINGPTMKSATERLGISLSELNKQETQVDLGQPVNLGEFDVRPNVYSVMLLVNFKTTTGAGEAAVPILGGLSYIRVRQRLVYVHTYRRYKSKADAAILRAFTTQWIGQILAANSTAGRR